MSHIRRNQTNALNMSEIDYSGLILNEFQMKFKIEHEFQSNAKKIEREFQMMKK